MTTDLILGTAGHIDHGKTALVRALTGVDTDRLPEEKRRGITIDLGFAELLLGDYRLGIVDVPGHERFVRNMLAGATGIDLVLLAVAADDSVKPQTREHLEILRLLDLATGVVAITKCDLADPDWLDLVEEDVRAVCAGSFLEGAPLVRTSVTRGLGLDELKAALGDAAAKAADSRRRRLAHAPFRMAIDRTFTVAGHGTVVTGSVGSGAVCVGDELEIQPGSVRVRVRGLHNHDRVVSRVQRGQRAAINLAGIHHDETRRGQELATPGHLVASRLLTARVRLLDSVPRALKHRSRLRVHLGTAELLATLALLDGDRLAPGSESFAQLHLSEDAVAVWGQPLILRSESPVATIGGGHVLDPQASRLRRGQPAALEMLEACRSPDPLARAAAAAYFVGLREWRPADWARTAGIEDPPAVYAQLLASGEVVEIPASASRTLRAHRLVLEELCQRVEAVLRKLHRENPLRRTVDLQPLRAAFRYLEEPLLAAAIERMVQAGKLRRADSGLTLEGEGPKLSQNERKLLTELVDVFRTAGIQTPSVKQCQERAGRSAQSVPQLIALAAAGGELVEIGPEYYLHADVDRGIRQQLAAALAGGRRMTLSEIRELLATSRKYAVPYCEYLDRSGFTRREGDLRYLAEPPP